MNNSLPLSLRGRAVLATWLSLAVIGVALSAPAVWAPARAAEAVQALTTALVLGNADNGYEADRVAVTLEELGVDVDRTKDNLAPDDDLGIGWDHNAELERLLRYQSVWYVEAYEGLKREEQDLLVEYVNAGGNLYLTGERPCCEELNASVTDVLNRLLTMKVTIGGMGDISGPFAFNGGARGDVASRPNLLVNFVPDSPGGMRIEGLEGVGGANVFASSDSVIVGGVWDESDMASGKGRAVVLMDIDWIASDDRGPVIENIANFLSADGLCSGVPDRGLNWVSGPEGCSTITEGTYTWTTKIDDGHGPYFDARASGGVGYKCGQTLTPPTATFTCEVSLKAVAWEEGAEEETGRRTLTIRAIADNPGRQIVRTVKVRPKNNPRNVPSPFSLNSNWWDWPDRDGDGIPDKWETDGVWVRGQHLDLPGLGANADHKDLFVRYDYEDGYAPSQRTLDHMTTMFASAPISNPDGGTGIDLHIGLGMAVPASVIGQDYYDLSRAALQRVGTYTGFFKSPGYGGDGVPMIYRSLVNRSAGTPEGYIGMGHIKGQFGWTGWDLDQTRASKKTKFADFAWPWEKKSRAYDFAQASNAAHELGHLLGLRHHHDAHKPNPSSDYDSIMNYKYANFGLLRDGNSVIDYSRRQPLLDWEIGEEFGHLSLIYGQNGEFENSASFYDHQPDQEVPEYGTAGEELSVEEQLQHADPDSVRSWFEEFEVPVEPSIPTLEDATATVRGGESVEIPLAGIDPDGGSLEYRVTGEPDVGTVMPTATGVIFAAPAGHVGTVTMSVRAVNGVFGSEPATVSVDVTPALLQRSGELLVEGTPKVGQTLTVIEQPVWIPEAEVKVEWLRDGEPIKDATATSYVLTAADEGKRVSVRLTASKEGYADDAVTSAPQTIAKADTPPVPKGEPAACTAAKQAASVSAGQVDTASKKVAKAQAKVKKLKKAKAPVTKAKKAKTKLKKAKKALKDANAANDSAQAAVAPACA